MSSRKQVNMLVDSTGKVLLEGSSGEVAAWLQTTMLNADKEIRQGVRKELTAAAKPLVERQRAAVRQVSSSGELTSATVDRAWNALTRATNSKTGLTERKVKNILGRSGLRESVARTVRVQNRQTDTVSAVNIRAVGSAMPAGQSKLPAAMDKGKWRHPVYGNRKVWAKQEVSPYGWFTVPAEKAMPAIQNKIFEVINRAIDNA